MLLLSLSFYFINVSSKCEMISSSIQTRVLNNAWEDQFCVFVPKLFCIVVNRIVVLYSGMYRPVGTPNCYVVLRDAPACWTRNCVVLKD